MKKILSFMLAIALIAAAVNATPNILLAATQTFDSNESESMRRLMDFGIFTKTAPEKMDLGRQVTREELAVILVLLNGQEDKTALYKSTSLYSDVSKTLCSSPYIATAVKLGYMTAMPDGKFHPHDKVSFAQAATIIGRLLKYGDKDLSGSYPQNYMTLLNNLGITEGMSLKSSSILTRGQLAVMLDRLLSCSVFGTGKTFLESVSIFQKAVILENSQVNPGSDGKRVVTDKGTFYLGNGIAAPEAGKQYLLRLKDKEIKNAALADLSFTVLSVKSVSSGIITSYDGEKTDLPKGIPYYYQGKAADYDSISSKITANASVVLGSDSEGVVYGALFDPLYSEPKVITSDMAGVSLEAKYSGFLIERAGKYITASQIEVNDVVYEVTDIWGKHGYILVESDTVSGIITAILPNRVSAESIELDGKEYALSESFPAEKLSSAGGCQAGETARLILGSDGRVVDIISDKVSGTEEYALVVNAKTENSVKAADFGTPYHTVTLLHTDGGKKTYRVASSMLSLKGKLVRYKVTASGADYDTVELALADYGADGGTYRVNKDERMLGEYYVANGAVLFNIKGTGSSGETEASVISFSDLSAGYLLDNKVKYLHRSGDFNDIDLMVLDNALEENICYGLVTNIKTTVSTAGSSQTVTFLVNGQSITYTGGETGLYLNSPARIKMSGNSIISVENAITAEASDNEIVAVDASRIRLNGKVYTYHRSISVYAINSDNTWKKLATTELKKGTDYRSVTVYLDKPLNLGGKVVMILLR